jgi:hypothetical protein
LVFLFVLLRTALCTTSFFGIAVSCILSVWPSHCILWHFINPMLYQWTEIEECIRNLIVIK